MGCLVLFSSTLIQWPESFSVPWAISVQTVPRQYRKITSLSMRPRGSVDHFDKQMAPKEADKFIVDYMSLVHRKITKTLIKIWSYHFLPFLSSVNDFKPFLTGSQIGSLFFFDYCCYIYFYICNKDMYAYVTIPYIYMYKYISTSCWICFVLLVCLWCHGWLLCIG